MQTKIIRSDGEMMDRIYYDPTRVMHEQFGLESDELVRLTPELERAQAEVLADAESWKSGHPVPKERQPLDAGFVELPERLLADYRDQGDSSEVSQIVRAADRIALAADRCVILGIGGSYMGTRALFESCCHPYHNELPRERRGSRPRIYFEGNNVDNDATQGLFDLLRSTRGGTDVEDQWGVVVVSKSGGTLETAVALRQFLAELQTACGGDRRRVAERLVAITGPSGQLRELVRTLGCSDAFTIPDGVGGRFSVLTAVGLLPAAILGLDVVELLSGAADANEHFRTAPVGENVVLDYTGVCHLMETKRGAHTRILSLWHKGLEAAGFWYDQLLAESLGKEGQGALPLTVLNTRDLHSRGQQHQQGRRDKLITNVIVDRVERESLPVGTTDWPNDPLNDLAGKTLPDLMAAAIAGTNRAYQADGRPTANLHLPRLTPYYLGQFFQTLMLATVVEGRLIGINPYGQPGVEGYKRHMREVLTG